MVTEINSKIVFEFPIRIQIVEENAEYYDYDDEWYFAHLKSRAEAEWNDENNMVKYLDDELIDVVSRMKMECILSNEMLCHIICDVSPDITEDEIDMLKEWIAGQMSDGWGESFEQRELTHFPYEEEDEVEDYETGEIYTDYRESTAYVYGQFWFSSGTAKWYIKRV